MIGAVVEVTGDHQKIHLPINAQLNDPIEWFELSMPVTATDEVVVNLVPFLAVFDDDDVRRTYDAAQWSDPGIRTADLSAYIDRRADRIHFNRYTGVAMK